MRVLGCRRAQWPGEEVSPDPFMDMELLGASFNTVSRKTEQEGASSLRSTEHGVLEGRLVTWEAQLHRQRLRGAGCGCTQGTPWLREGRMRGLSRASLCSPRGPMEHGLGQARGWRRWGLPDTLLLPRCPGSLVPCSRLCSGPWRGLGAGIR